MRRPTVGRGSGPPPLREVTYVLPLRRQEPAPDPDLAAYLSWLAERLEVVVADGSPPAVFADHHRQWGHLVEHVPVVSRCRNGKVAGVLDGAHVASGAYLVICDDDVRYDDDNLRRVIDLLADADLVRPQNFFAPLPWHARWDTARSLLNRAFRADYPGTLAIRRATLEKSHGYCGAVLFENLELIRTARAHGAREVIASDVYVRRVPPPVAHFRNQRVRQAYDSLAQPGRLAVEAALLPAVVLAWHGKRARWVPPAIAAVTVALAEIGRRRHHGREIFSPWAPWWAPLWTAERAVCIWLALMHRVRGGVPYTGQRLVRAAHSSRRVSSDGCPEKICSCRVVSAARPAEGWS